MSSYGGFVLLDEYMPIKDIENSDNSSEFLIVVQLYGAVPLGTDVSSGVDISVISKERFCCLGETYRSFMMDVQTLISRCDRDERRNDYEQLRIVRGCQPFGLWSEEGKLVSIPSNILQNSRGYPEFDPWDVRQKENWIKILRELQCIPLIGKLKVHILNYVDQEDFMVSPLKQYDAVLSTPWFHKKSIPLVYPERELTFVHKG